MNGQRGGSDWMLVAGGLCAAGVLVLLAWLVLSPRTRADRERASGESQEEDERQSARREGEEDERASGGAEERRSGERKADRGAVQEGGDEGPLVITGGRGADPGPRPDDSEGPDDYPYCRKRQDCSEFKRRTSEFKVLAVQVDRAAQKAAHMTDEEEEKIGDEAWAETARQKQGQISDSGPQAEYVREVGRKLLPGIKRKGISYDFHVVVDDSLNAFALPGGHIAVHTGLLARLENEAQLAGVLGHEIEHVDLKHCIANWALAKELGGEVNDLSFGLVLFFRVPVRSEQEREADARGTELARLAGYSPFQTVTFMERLPPHEKWSESVDIGIRVGDPLLDRILNAMQKQVLDELQNVVDSHPSPAQRACELKQQLFDFMAKEPRRWYFVGKARYANVPPPRAL